MIERIDRNLKNERLHRFKMSDSEKEVITRKPKTTKLFNSDDDESDNDKKSEKSSGFVDHSDDSQGSSKSLSSRTESDDELRKAVAKKNKLNDSPTKSKKSDSSDDEKRSQSRKSRSSSSSSDDEKTPRSKKSGSSSSSSDDKKPPKSRKSRSNSSSSERSRSRKSSRSSSSSGDEKRSQCRKSRSSSSDGKRSQSRKSRSSSSSSGDEKRSQSRKSGSSSSSSGDEKRFKFKSDSSDNETHSQSKKSNSSDNDSRSASSQMSNKNNASDNEKSASSLKPSIADSDNTQQKSGGKYSLITASDLESEDDTRPVVNESMSDDEFPAKSNKKAKKLHKKKSSSKKSAHLKSSGASHALDSSDSDNEESSSPKRVQKSAAKRKSETKPPKGSKASKTEKDPLLSIRSETQRMIREGRISLPYHQPKQRSLHEFLQRRKAAPSIPLKATSEVMRSVCAQLINKEKEVEDFYKSESDNSDAETQPSNLPETETNEVNNIAKDDKAASIDLPVNKQASAEMELDKDTNSTLADDHENENSSIVSAQNKDANSTLIDNSPERVDPESKKSDDAESEKLDENTSPQKPLEPVIPEENTTEPIAKNASNPERNPEENTPMDVDEDAKNPPEDSQDLVNVAKSKDPATEHVDERDIPDSEDFVLQLEDSCNYDIDDITKPSNPSASKVLSTDDITKPSKPPASEMLPDSADFELRIEDSSCNETESVPLSEPEKSTVNSTEPTSKPVISKDRIKNRIEALLSTRNIKLSSIKLNSAPESIQFEIPSFQPEPSGIRELKEKFVKHSMAKKKPKSTPSHVSVVTTQTDTEGGVIGVTKETLTLGLNDEENEFSNPKLNVPGAKHAYLKKKMLDMLISKKEATWNEYQNEKRKYYGSDDEEENDIDGDNDDDDDDVATCKKLNFEPYHPEDEPDDDELVEDDVVYEEKTREKNCFLDEEAEVSEVEDEEDDNLVGQDAGKDDDDDDDDDDKDSVDSDGLDFHVKDDSPSKPNKSNDDAESDKLFKYNTTGSDLEKKLLGLESISQSNFNDDVSASEIFGLCSGTFATQHLSKNNNAGAASAANDDDDFFIDSQNADDSQNICLSLPDTDNTVEKSTEESNKYTPFTPNHTPDNEEDEEEEIFTRKRPTMRIVEDSDEETTEPTNEVTTNENDASDEDNGVDDQDEVDEEDDENINEDEEEVDGVEAEEFGYNSEEELVTYDKAAAREFFENEAELSESEWGSEDENEKDLDKLEKEEGDDDEIDADELKEELGKIHMRQLLDDDQHDVRLLKEMLLEDGELHSDAKRQRKFQWKNLTDGDDFFKNHSYDSDDENNLNDDDNDESEEHWRKIRHERETFLSQQEKKSILNETVTESAESTFASTKIIGENIVTKIVQRTSFSSNANASKDKPDQDLSKINPKFKCGSFLSRGKLLLSKMTLSVSETKENLRGAKNGRNFVFGAKSPQKEQVTVTVEKTEKRKSTSTSTSVSKKVRLSVDNGTTPAPRKGLLARLALTE